MATESFVVQGVCYSLTGQPLQGKCIAKESVMLWENLPVGMELVDCLNIPMNGCKEETFVHFYVKKNNLLVKHTNKWPSTALNELARPSDVCLLSNGVSLTRKCSYNSHKYEAEWQRLDDKIKCLNVTNQNIITADLNVLLKEVEHENKSSAIDNVHQLTNLLSRPNTQRIASDLDISTNILEILTLSHRTPTMASKLAEVTNIIMQSSQNAVLNSRVTNTPNKLLRTVETYFDDMTAVFQPNTSDCSDLPDGVKYFIENSTSIFYIYPICSNVSGIGVYRPSSEPGIRYDNHTNTHFKYLYLNESLEDITRSPHLIVAVHVPELVWQGLQMETPKEKRKFLAMRISLYKNRNFFIGQDNRIPDNVVLRIAIPGHKDEVPGIIPYIFYNPDVDQQQPMQCGSYNYDNWISSGESYKRFDNIAVCEKRILGFGSLLRLKPTLVKATDMEILSIIIGYSQDIITIFGCILSLFGLLGIWLTALCCRQWRRESSNPLLLNICLVLTMIMTYFLFINLGDMRESLLKQDTIGYCMLEGAFLQYSILVLFLWMLIIAYLQYVRYIAVVHKKLSRMQCIKCILIAWGLPVVPTLLVIHFEPFAYMPLSENGLVSSDICYPSGRSFYFGIFIPISTVVVVNVAIFVFISCSLCFKKNPHLHNKQERKNFVVRLRLTILLFFLLGISWLFGILAHMQENQVLSLLFCLTSTLQGFVLFFFFVAYDKNIRKSWLVCACGKDYILEDDVSSPMNTLRSNNNCG